MHCPFLKNLNVIKKNYMKSRDWILRNQSVLNCLKKVQKVNKKEVLVLLCSIICEIYSKMQLKEMTLKNHYQLQIQQQDKILNISLVLILKHNLNKYLIILLTMQNNNSCLVFKKYVQLVDLKYALVRKKSINNEKKFGFLIFKLINRLFIIYILLFSYIYT